MPRRRTTRAAGSALCVPALSLTLLGCGSDRIAAETAVSEPPAAARPHQAELAELRAYEDELRARTDFAALPSHEHATGPNPFAVAPVADRHVGILRGADAVVLLDASARELHRVPAPETPTGLALDGNAGVLVSGLGSSTIAHYRTDGNVLVRDAEIVVPDLVSIRTIALTNDALDVIDGHRGRILAFRLERSRGGSLSLGSRTDVGRCAGPIGVLRTSKYHAVNCLLDHTVEVRALEGTAVPTTPVVRIEHDGPIWSMSADGGQLIAVGAVENRPLDRSDGFGFIDSFVYVYELGPGGQVRELAAVNVSELGVVTPKWLELRSDGNETTALVTGYGSDRVAELRWPERVSGPPAITTHRAVPGTTSLSGTLAAGVAANPLLDAFVAHHDGSIAVEPVPSDLPVRSADSRVGEALVFTTLMAPWNRSDDHHSRFTCETCHFEGGGDGRTHFTGRGEVHATTKPLFGLFNNRPHFTRALDRTTTKMAHNEFRVANHGSGRDPWFSLAAEDAPWIAHLGELPELTPSFLRRALMTFLVDLTHPQNPVARGHSAWTHAERRGAELFRERCESCHAARLVTDDAGTRVPFERWEELTLHGGAIVWCSDAYEKTGVTPYVHEQGARVTSLRRLFVKHPYFTNGSAKDLDEVLARAAFVGDGFFHDRAPVGNETVRLTADERSALRAFVELL